ncbi:MAG: hypothetical protein RJA70_2088 [Pseudomonadota bacterium]|jgi:hypothetical protein
MHLVPGLVARVVFTAFTASLSLSCSSERGETGVGLGNSEQGERDDLPDQADAGSSNTLDSGVGASTFDKNPEVPPSGTPTSAPPATSELESPPATAVPLPCKLEFSVETEDSGGNSRKEGAIWITDKHGVALRVLEAWWHRYPQAPRLNKLRATFGLSDLRVGTRLDHRVTWDCTDLNGELVPLGTYAVHVHAATNRTTPAPYFAIPFEHTGTVPLKETIAPIRGFRGATLSYEPEDASSALAPEPTCTEFSTSAADWCELTTSCPGALKQTSCWVDPYPGLVRCACADADGYHELVASGVAPAEACHAARDECQNPSSLGPRECELSFSSEEADQCSLSRECWLPATRNGITLGYSSTSTGVSCSRANDQSDLHCACDGPSIDSFTIYLDPNPSTRGLCEELINVCDEDIVFEKPNCDPITSGASDTSCDASRECRRRGVTTSGRQVLEHPVSANSHCTRADTASTAWQCSCDGAEVSLVEGEDGLQVCAQALEGCAPQ